MDIPSIVLIAVLCVAIGFFLGRLFTGGGGNQPSDSAHPDWEEIMQVWRDSRKDNLVVTIGNITFERGTNLNSKIRNHILQAILQLHQWLEPQAVQPSPRQETESLPSDNPNDPHQKPAWLEATPPPPKAFDPQKVLANALLIDIPDSAFKADSIVEQIDNILQLILKESPEKDRAIRLMDIPNKGMVVMIGLDQYEEIDDIPDNQIKALIRQAVWLWENRKEKSP